jgi:thioredoxin 1
MSVHEIHSTEELDKVLNSRGVNIIDWKANWCAPCSALSPKMEELAKGNTNVSFYKVDVDELNESASHHKVMAMPTIHFWKDGQLVDQVVGANYKKIKELVEKYK